MKLNIKFLGILFLTVSVSMYACKKTEYKFGDIKTPSDLALTAVVVGTDANNPNGNGTGRVTINTTASNALTYKIDFGDGKSEVVPGGSITYKYTNPGTAEYTITINAVGTGGAISTISKKVKVFVAFEIPASIIAGLTNGSSRVWVSDKDANGHFGVGPSDAFAPIWYAAGPNSRDACSYDDEITFSKDVNNNIFMAIDNKGQSFSIGAATSFYGFGGGDTCLGVSVTGTKKLAFMDATSASTTANSTRIQFAVPGNGLIIFGTGGTTYEILELSATNMTLRNIGIDGNSWYQKLRVK